MALVPCVQCRQLFYASCHDASCIDALCPYCEYGEPEDIGASIAGTPFAMTERANRTALDKGSRPMAARAPTAATALRMEGGAHG